MAIPNNRFLAATRYTWVSSLVVLGVLVGLTAAKAQNVTMFGGNSLAKECFDLSNVAALTGTASRTDLETCDQAIFHGELSREHLIATYVNRGIIKMAMQDYPAAARDYNKALALSDEVGEAYVNRGNLWFMSNRLSEAIEDYNKALKFGIERPHVAFLNRGMAHEQLGNFDEAKLDYQAALEKVPAWTAAQKRLDRVKAKIAASTQRPLAEPASDN